MRGASMIGRDAVDVAKARGLMPAQSAPSKPKSIQQRALEKRLGKAHAERANSYVTVVDGSGKTIDKATLKNRMMEGRKVSPVRDEEEDDDPDYDIDLDRNVQKARETRDKLISARVIDQKDLGDYVAPDFRDLVNDVEAGRATIADDGAFAYERPAYSRGYKSVPDFAPRSGSAQRVAPARSSSSAGPSGGKMRSLALAGRYDMDIAGPGRPNVASPNDQTGFGVPASDGMDESSAGPSGGGTRSLAPASRVASSVAKTLASSSSREDEIDAMNSARGKVLKSMPRGGNAQRIAGAPESFAGSIQADARDAMWGDVKVKRLKSQGPTRAGAKSWGAFGGPEFQQALDQETPEMEVGMLAMSEDDDPAAQRAIADSIVNRFRIAQADNPNITIRDVLRTPAQYSPGWDTAGPSRMFDARMNPDINNLSSYVRDLLSGKADTTMKKNSYYGRGVNPNWAKGPKEKIGATTFVDVGEAFRRPNVDASYSGGPSRRYVSLGKQATEAAPMSGWRNPTTFIDAVEDPDTEFNDVGSLQPAFKNQLRADFNINEDETDVAALGSQVIGDFDRMPSFGSVSPMEDYSASFQPSKDYTRTVETVAFRDPTNTDLNPLGLSFSDPALPPQGVSLPAPNYFSDVPQYVDRVATLGSPGFGYQEPSEFDDSGLVTPELTAPTKQLSLADMFGKIKPRAVSVFDENGSFVGNMLPGGDIVKNGKKIDYSGPLIGSGGEPIDMRDQAPKSVGRPLTREDFFDNTGTPQFGGPRDPSPAVSAMRSAAPEFTAGNDPYAGRALAPRAYSPAFSVPIGARPRQLNADDVALNVGRPSVTEAPGLPSRALSGAYSLRNISGIPSEEEQAALIANDVPAEFMPGNDPYAYSNVARPAPVMNMLSQSRPMPSLAGALVNGGFPQASFAPASSRSYQPMVAARPDAPLSFQSMIAGRPEVPGALPAEPSPAVAGARYMLPDIAPPPAVVQQAPAQRSIRDVLAGLIPASQNPAAARPSMGMSYTPAIPSDEFDPSFFTRKPEEVVPGAGQVAPPEDPYISPTTDEVEANAVPASGGGWLDTIKQKTAELAANVPSLADAQSAASDAIGGLTKEASTVANQVGDGVRLYDKLFDQPKPGDWQYEALGMGGGRGQAGNQQLAGDAPAVAPAAAPTATDAALGDIYRQYDMALRDLATKQGDQAAMARVQSLERLLVAHIQANGNQGGTWQRDASGNYQTGRNVQLT